MQRKEKSIDGELCANWELIDSFGVRLEDRLEDRDSYDYYSSGNYSYYDDYSNYSIYHTDGYEKFYDNPRIIGYFPENVWLRKYATVDHRSLYGEKGFILQNGTFERFEPIGITWKDSYCRRITDTGPSGCFVERNLSARADFDRQENNCAGTDSTNLLRVVTTQ